MQNNMQDVKEIDTRCVVETFMLFIERSAFILVLLPIKFVFDFMIKMFKIIENISRQIRHNIRRFINNYLAGVERMIAKTIGNFVVNCCSIWRFR